MQTPSIESGSDRDRVSDVLDLLPFGILVADADGMATTVNRAWTQLTAQTDSGWTGLGWLDVLDSADPADHSTRFTTVLTQGARGVDCSVQDLTGQRHVLHLQSVPEVEHDRVVRVVVTVADVTTDRAWTEQLLDQATHDPLTGLFNRSQFLEFVGHSLDRQRREPNRIAAVFFLDVDGLKATNDALGHAAGDQLLRDAASRITAAVRPADIVARYGGDEFTVLCEELRDLDEVSSIADRIRDPHITGCSHQCTLSVGYAIADDPDLDPATIVARADRAMYLIKRHKQAATASSRSCRLPPSASTALPVSDLNRACKTDPGSGEVAGGPERALRPSGTLDQLSPEAQMVNQVARDLLSITVTLSSARSLANNLATTRLDEAVQGLDRVIHGLRTLVLTVERRSRAQGRLEVEDPQDGSEASPAVALPAPRGARSGRAS